MNYIEKFLIDHPIYNNITYRTNDFPVATRIHPILTASQAIIDSLIESENKRIAIILPDDELNIKDAVAQSFDSVLDLYIQEEVCNVIRKCL